MNIQYGFYSQKPMGNGWIGRREKKNKDKEEEAVGVESTLVLS